MKVWRYTYDITDPVVCYSASGDSMFVLVDGIIGLCAYFFFKAVVTLSGPGGATFRAFDSETGDLLVEKRLHDPAEGHLSEPVELGSRLDFDKSSISGSSKDLYALTNGRNLRKIDALTGEIKWEWFSEEGSVATLTAYQ